MPSEADAKLRNNLPLDDVAEECCWISSFSSAPAV
jgi:hypothetical protein